MAIRQVKACEGKSKKQRTLSSRTRQRNESRRLDDPPDSSRAFRYLEGGIVPNDRSVL